MLSEEENKAIGEIDISKTIESNINYWRNKCLEQQKEIDELKDKNRTLETLLQGNLYEMYKYYRELANSYQANCISKDKIRECIQTPYPEVAIENIVELLEENNGK